MARRSRRGVFTIRLDDGTPMMKGCCSLKEDDLSNGGKVDDKGWTYTLRNGGDRLGRYACASYRRGQRVHIVRSVETGGNVCSDRKRPVAPRRGLARWRLAGRMGSRRSVWRSRSRSYYRWRACRAVLRVWLRLRL